MDIGRTFWGYFEQQDESWWRYREGLIATEPTHILLEYFVTYPFLTNQYISRLPGISHICAICDRGDIIYHLFMNFNLRLSIRDCIQNTAYELAVKGENRDAIEACQFCSAIVIQRWWREAWLSKRLRNELIV